MNSGYLKGLSSATDKHTLNLVNDQVVLCPLTEADADFFMRFTPIHSWLLILMKALF